MTRDEEMMEEAYERARATGGADTFGVMAALEEDDDETPSPDEMRAAIGGVHDEPDAPAETPVASTPDVPPPPPMPPAEVQTSAARPAAAEARRLLGSINTRKSSSALPEAMKRDSERANSQRVSDFMRAAFTRRPVQFSPSGPQEADAVRAQESTERLAEDSANRQKLAAAGLLGKLDPRPVDPSLAERRKNLSLEAQNRLKLSEQQLAALIEERKRKGTVDDRGLDLRIRQLEEQIRHNQATEAAKKKPVGPHPVTAVKAGNIDTVPAQYREVVKAIAEGRMEAPKAASRFGSDVLKYVVAYKPDFDATKFGNYAAVSKQQATGKDVMAIDVAREHVKTAKRLIPQNASPQFVNRVKQAIAAGTGDPEFAPFIAASTFVAHELARINNIDDQAGKQEVLHMLSPVQSPEQLIAVFDTFDELTGGKQLGLKRQLDRVAPTSSQPAPAPAPGGHGKVTPSGKPYARKQVNKATGRVRYVDEAGAVVEESDG